MHIQVRIPRHCYEERRYTLSVLLETCLGLGVNFIPSEGREVAIVVDNFCSIILVDYFFRELPQEPVYTLDLLPRDVDEFAHDMGDTVCMYGRASVSIEEDTITVHNDIVASSFFMLSRWEELVISDRDHHNRFSALSSTAYKYGFLDRAIVNEYASFLLNCIRSGNQMVIKSSRQFKVIPTHDVDLPRLAPTAGRMVTSLARAVVTNRDFNYTRRLCSAFLRGRDPFDTFDELMDRSEASGLQSHFFFMSGGVTRFDNYYSIDDPSIKVLMDRIRGRGHIIGFHPSYNAYNDAELFKQELQRLESVAGVEVKSGRHHYLRFGVGETWPIWEDNGMEWDSTLSFADEVGFRCGICLPFNVFDVKTRRSLALVEKPLIVMDGSLVTYQSVSNQEAIDKVKRVKETCRRFDGDFVFLWHNSAFFTPLWSDKTDILDYLYEA